MRDTALKSRGIEDAGTGVLLVAAVARAGYVTLNVLAGTQPLGKREWLFLVRHLVAVGLAVWPEARAEVGAVLAAARDHAGASKPEARP